MKNSEIKEWSKCIMKKDESEQPVPIHLNGLTLATTNLKHALFETQSREKNTAVLFCISIQNYKKFSGFRLNNDSYTLDNQKKDEVLLQEGIAVYVLKVEKIQIENISSSLNDLTGKSIVVINLFHLG